MSNMNRQDKDDHKDQGKAKPNADQNTGSGGTRSTNPAQKQGDPHRNPGHDDSQHRGAEKRDPKR